MKNLIILFFILIHCSYIVPLHAEFNLPIFESFDAQQIPPGWYGDVINFDSGWRMLHSSNAGGKPYELEVGWYWVWAGFRYIISPPINVSGVNAVRVSFRHNFMILGDKPNAVGLAHGPAFVNSDWMEMNEDWEYIVIGHTGSGGTSIPPEQYEVIIPSPGDVLYIAWFGWALYDGPWPWFECRWYVDDIQITRHKSSPELVPVYRFVNSVKDLHLYTISEKERDYIIKNLPEWNYEGPKFRVYSDYIPDFIPVYRFFNTMTGIHLYTISEHERNAVYRLPEWDYEGIKFFISNEIHYGTLPVFRFFNHISGGHLYTICGYEKNVYMHLPDWTYEGIPFRVFPLDNLSLMDR